MKLEPHQAPLYEALVRHGNLDAVSFHVPGHKQRLSEGDKEGGHGRPIFGAGVLELDLTELSDTDDLHHPEGAIAQAQQLAAACFGAEMSFFLIGGSTVGNLAMIMALCAPGELMLVQRNVHKSVIHGLTLAGARAVFLPPEIDGHSGLAVAPSLARVQEGLRRYPEAKALLLSNPNYCGQAADLTAIVQAAHEHGMPVLVDEAHGPHFGRHPALPGSALQAGADIVVQSAHKMLSAMTMSAMLHMQGDRAPREAVRQYLRMLQSSSPSYPLMASLDLARRELHVNGSALFEEPLRAAARVREGLRDAPIVPLEPSRLSTALDPLKLTLCDSTGKLSGYQLRDELEKLGCIAEMADDRYALLVLGTRSKAEDGDRLVSALRRIAVEHGLGKRSKKDKPRRSAPSQTEEAEARLSERLSEPVSFSRIPLKTEAVALHEAIGRLCGEWIIPYPPGIPVLYPGEPITQTIVRNLERWQVQGARVQGAADASLRTIQVAIR